MEFSTQALYRFLAKPCKADKIMKRFSEVPKRQITAALNELLQSGQIVRNKKNFYAQSQHFGCLSGTYCATEKKFAFVSPDDPEAKEDIFVPPGNDGGAFEGDRVLVRISPDRRRSTSGKLLNTGKVIQILERNKSDLIGTLQVDKGRYYMVPNSRKYPQVEIPKRKLAGAAIGDQIAVAIVFYGDKRNSYIPQGMVREVLGKSNTMEAAIAGILHSNNIRPEFPPAVIEEAEDVSKEAFDPTGRLDLRQETIFTIDGDHSKDFDDAVSLKTLPNGNYELGVHIADVSHFVRPESPLDTEAYIRGTSVYYADRVIPMLPIELSNGICSLNPNEDRYAFSVIMELDKSGHRKNYRCAKSVIRSCARMTYNKVNQILQGDPALCQEYDFLVNILTEMNQLAKKRLALRFQRGAIELGIEESEILCDENGKCIGVEKRQRGDSEKLIEEFMLLANETVAEFMFQSATPCVYRVHEKPDPEKLRAFASFAYLFGYRMDMKTPDDPHQLQEILNKAAEHPEQIILATMLLRSMAKARYSAECIGHYGLGAKFYLHFTSPIRRYPDLVVHRMLARKLEGSTFQQEDIDTCEEAAEQSSDREVAADTAERDIEKLYMADYLSAFIGEEFDAVISSIQNFGIFVQLPSGIEGLIRVEAMKDDYYVFDAEKLSFVGKRSGRKFIVGHPIHVRLLNASCVTGLIDFELA
jgi:ribonuclease R